MVATTESKLDEFTCSNERIDTLRFVLVAVQVALVLVVAVSYRLELERGFTVVAGLILAGFLVHSWLPLRARLPFFLGLSFTAIGLLLRADGVWLLMTGFALIALCHLPARWAIRVGVLVVVAICLAMLRAGWIKVVWGPTVLPVIGAIFMFRLILYMYDLKEERTPASIWQRLSYFFLLPNICFPLFPVVDYKTFLKTYYDAPAAEIYQKGVFWMFRGVLHLLLYRLIYFQIPRAETDLPGLLGVYVFMAMTYALYLRVSGLFHLIAGSLCLFGFNLPQTNNHYFLASSFNNLWRRINIYWKDFMMTTTFYPVFMGTRALRTTSRLVVATGLVFVATWFFHSYQWFWLQGVFPIAMTDILFWGVLGVALAMNSVWEAHQGGRRRVGAKAGSLGDSLRATLRILGVFSFMAILWSLWYSSSLAEWSHRILRVRNSSVADVVVLAVLLLVVLCVGAMMHWLSANGRGPARLQRITWRYSFVLVPTVASILILVDQHGVRLRLGDPAIALVIRAQSTSLNATDRRRQERGYYEELSRATQFGAPTMMVRTGEWVGLGESEAAEPTRDIRGIRLKPNVETRFRGSTLSTNAWGMRDRDYEKPRPAGTYRAAMVGPSIEMGVGVRTEQTFENLVEDRLNRNTAGSGFNTYEILNFSVGGYGALDALFVIRNLVSAFDPQIIIYVIHPEDARRMIDRLQLSLERGTRMGLSPEAQLVGYEPVLAALRSSRALESLPNEEFQRRMEPHRNELLAWTYQEMAKACRQQDATPVFVMIPLPRVGFEDEERTMLSDLIRQVGGVRIELEAVYDGYGIEDLRIAEWDTHPNQLGHKLIADKLHPAMLAAGGSLGLHAPASGSNRERM